MMTTRTATVTTAITVPLHRFRVLPPSLLLSFALAPSAAMGDFLFAFRLDAMVKQAHKNTFSGLSRSIHLE
jgi:hypothetical protein